MCELDDLFDVMIDGFEYTYGRGEDSIVVCQWCSEQRTGKPGLLGLWIVNHKCDDKFLLERVLEATL